MSLQTQINSGGLPSTVPTPLSPVAGTSIVPTTEQIQLTNAGAVAMTATPTLSTTGIASGTRVTLLQTGAGSTTFSDEGTLAGTALKLASSTRTLTQNQTLVLIYNGTYWCEQSYSASGGSGPGIVPFNANIDDPYTTLLLQMTGLNGGTSFPDTGYNAFTMVNGGAATTSTAQSKFGTSSGLFTGAAGSYVGLASGTGKILIGTKDFTFEAWVYMTANTPFGSNPPFSTAIIDTRSTPSTPGVLCSIAAPTNYLTAIVAGTGVYSTSAVPLNTWTHCCWMRKSGSVYCFLNGVVDATVTSVVNSVTDDTVTVGMSIERSVGYPLFQGYMNDVRFSNGLARYSTAGFTPSTTPLIAGYAPAYLPASPAAGQLALSTYNLYACTNASGPVWKRSSLTTP